MNAARKDQLTNKVNFDLIRYANCWEDADILLKGLSAQPGSRILSVCSAGDNSLSLLTTGAQKVVAVDINNVQLMLTELKIAAFKSLEYEELLEFLGFFPSDNRHNLYRKLRKELSAETNEYWSVHFDQIEQGVISQGKFEKYFRLYRTKILKLIHTEKRVRKLFEEKSAKEQEEFYFNRWNNRRWKILFKLFFSKHVMGKYGRDPEFLKHVKVTVCEFIYSKAEEQLKSTNAQTNYFLHFIHTGTFGKTLPHYARSENFETIRNNIDRLNLHLGFAEDALSQHKGITHMNLSNIFEYMDADTFRNTVLKLNAKLEPSGRMAYWNLMVPRSASDVSPELNSLQKLSEELSAQDNGFFYNRFIVDEKK